LNRLVLSKSYTATWIVGLPKVYFIICSGLRSFHDELLWRNGGMVILLMSFTSAVCLNILRRVALRFVEVTGNAAVLPDLRNVLLMSGDFIGSAN